MWWFFGGYLLAAAAFYAYITATAVEEPDGMAASGRNPREMTLAERRRQAMARVEDASSRRIA